MSFHVRRNLVATFAAGCVALGLMGAAAPQAGEAGQPAPSACPTQVSGLAHAPSRVGRILGIVRPTGVGTHCASPIGATAPGSVPPLLNHGGPVMATPSAGNQVVVTPIFWEPSGYPFTAGYKNLITRYLQDVAAASERIDNVFGTVFEYSGSNGAINYRMTVGAPISDTTAFPAAGCTTNGGSTYADASGYTTCLDDDQVIAETDAVVAAHSLARDYGHLYVVFLPKHVESCFYPGNPAYQACTINPTPSAAYCAYHSSFVNGGDTIYATMPFPVYGSATGYTCTDEHLGPTKQVQAPNGNPDADVEISPLSHEMAEAITDPDGNAWYDSAGFENGDECAYIYETLHGSAGAFYNQTIHGHRYLTQEEFSNADYHAGHDGCLPGGKAVVPHVTAVSPGKGSTAGRTKVTVTGTGFPGASSVKFGGKAARFTITDATHLTATAPKSLAAGPVDITVSTSAGTSRKVTTDRFVYQAPRPTVTSLSPGRGTRRGGTKVTIRGTGFVKGAIVRFGTAKGTSVTVVSATKITVRSPKHARGKVLVRVRTRGGTSATARAAHYRFT